MFLKNKKIIFTITILLLNIFLFNNLISNVYAAGGRPTAKILEKLETTAKDNAGYAEVDEDSAKNIVAKIIKSILGLVGIFFLILVISGGYQWMTSGGNDEVIAKAKKKVINATIGLVLIIFAYSIFVFLFEKLSEALLFSSL